GLMSTARACDNGQPPNPGAVPARIGDTSAHTGNVPTSFSTDLLRSQSELLPLILDNMGDGLVVADEKGHIVFFNPAAQRVLGTNITNALIGDFAQRYGVFDPLTGLPF